MTNKPTLPNTIPVLALDGWTLFPHVDFPLFLPEKDIEHLILQSTDGFIGVIQRMDTEDPQDESPSRAVFSHGCLARLGRTGRSLTFPGKKIHRTSPFLPLRGVCRFEIEQRRLNVMSFPLMECTVNYGSYYAHDVRDPFEALDTFEEHHEALLAFGALLAEDIELNGILGEEMDGLPLHKLVNHFSAFFPFFPQERQALLESPTLEERLEVLVSLLEMASLPLVSETVH